jgi:hypothetical protein
MARHKEARDKSQIAGRGVASAGLVFVPPFPDCSPSMDRFLSQFWLFGEGMKGKDRLQNVDHT